jgi:N-acetylglucosamine kinase-like BadF-type ATPase
MAAFRSETTFAVDAGGSRTSVRALRLDGSRLTWQRQSIAIATVGEAQAVHRLGDVLADLAAELGTSRPAWGCVASSSMPALGEAPAPQALVATISNGPLSGCTALVNDLVPLLWSDHLKGCGVVVSSGTGSSVLARDEEGRLVKVGGHEHILSDQGSAYAIARAGLRAATRAVDGAAAATVLVDRAQSFYHRSLPALGRWFAELDRARSEVARFAPQVLAAAEAGDEAAQTVAITQADALAASTVTAMGRLDLGASPRIGLSGGVVRGSAYFRALISAAIEAKDLCPTIEVLDGLESALAFVEVALGEDGPELVRSVGGLLLSVP